MNTQVNTNYQFRVLKAKGKEKYYPQIKYPGSVEWSFDVHPEYKSIVVRDTYDDAVKIWKMDLRYQPYIHGNEDVPLVREDPNERVLLEKWAQIYESSFENFKETKNRLIQYLNRVFEIINPIDVEDFDFKFKIFDWDVCNWNGNRCIHLYVFNYNYINPSFADFFFPYELLNYANENDIMEDFKAFLKKYPNTFRLATAKK